MFPSSGATTGPRQAPPESPTTFRGSGLVLVVDDEEVVRQMAQRMLERCGFTVLQAGDGRQGLDLFQTRAADIRLVLLDLTMPRLDGLQAFKEIRRLRPQVPVILTSGYTEQEAITRFDGLGLTGFLQKPFSWQDLLVALRRGLPSA
jgi:CheY-like chemotaxis protein